MTFFSFDSRTSVVLLAALAWSVSCGGSTTVEGGSGAGGQGGSGANGGNGGTAGGGGSPTTCEQLEADYLSTFPEALECDPAIDVEQCTQLTFTTLTCPCEELFANPDSDGATTLDTLQEAWNDQQCGALIDCPAIACEPPTMGLCVPDPGSPLGGRCESS